MCTIAKLAPSPSHLKTEDVKLAPSLSQPKPDDAKLALLPSQPEPELAPSPSQTKPEDDVDIEVSDESGDDEDALVPTEEDLETDEAVWALYRRCVRILELRRTEEEMRKRFCFFKKCAHKVFGWNKNSEIPCSALSIWCDITDDEQHQWQSKWPTFKGHKYHLQSEKQPKKPSWCPKAKIRWEKMMQMRLLRKQQRLEEGL